MLQKPMGVTIPVVWCSQVWVWVDKKHPGITHVMPYQKDQLCK
jgi:hypothetical protein